MLASVHCMQADCSSTGDTTPASKLQALSLGGHWTYNQVTHQFSARLSILQTSKYDLSAGDCAGAYSSAFGCPEQITRNCAAAFGARRRPYGKESQGKSQSLQMIVIVVSLHMPVNTKLTSS